MPASEPGYPLQPSSGPRPEGYGIPVALRVDAAGAEEQFQRADGSSNPMNKVVYILYGLSLDCTRADKVSALLQSAVRLTSEVLVQAVGAVKRPRGMDLTAEPFIRSLSEALKRKCDGTVLLQAADEALKLELKAPAAAIASSVIERVTLDTAQLRKQSPVFIRAIRILMSADDFDRAGKIVRDNLNHFSGAKDFAEISKIGTEIESKLFELKAVSAREGGGFRELVRDSAGQRAAREAEQRVLSSESLDEQLKISRAEYLENPKHLQAVEKYVSRLLQAGNETEALRVLENAYEETREKRVFHQASDLRVKVEEARLRSKEPGGLSDEARARLLGLRIAEMKRRVEVDPDAAMLYRDLGALHLRVPDSAEVAVSSLQRSLALDGSSRETLVLLVRAFAQMGRVEEVLAVCERVQATIPEEERQPWKSKVMLQLTFEKAKALATRGSMRSDASQMMEASRELARVSAIDAQFPELSALREKIESHPLLAH